MSRGCFEIASLPADVDPDEVVEAYYLPQRPFVIRGIARSWPATQRWTPSYLMRHLGASSDATPSFYWFNIGEGLLAEDYEVPAVVQRLHARPRVFRKQQPLRMWISAAGTVTPWHYDGNSLQTLNTQVRGRKRFTLVDPDTPLRPMSFTFAAQAGYAPIEELAGPDTRYTTFELEAGDLAFIPQHWYHTVASLDPVNINLNWVFTDLDVLLGASSATAVRERESVACLYTIWRAARFAPGSDRAFIWSYLRTYGGPADFEVAARLAREHGWGALARRFARELGRGGSSWRAARRTARDELRVNGGVRRNPFDYFDRTGEPREADETGDEIDDERSDQAVAEG